MSIFDKQIEYKPFNYDEITKPFIEAIWASHWTHREFNFDSDIQDFKIVMSDEEREVVRRAALLISQVEVAVKNYWGNIGKIFPQPDIADVGATFSGNEAIHSRAYSRILDKLNLNDDFKQILTDPVIKGRVDYLTKYVNKIYKNDHKNILYSLVLFTLFTENVSLFSQFYVLLGFQRFKNLMKDVSNVVDYTMKEEVIHAQFGISLFNQVKKEFPELIDEEFTQRIYHEVTEALDAEEKIIEWMLNGYENEFLNKDILITFLKDRINTSLKQIGFEPICNVDKKILKQSNWIREEILSDASTDFFSKKPIGYSKKTKSFTEEDLF